MAGALALPRMGLAAPGASLRATSRVLEVNGRAATVFGLVNAAGGHGLVLGPGQRFAVSLSNELTEDTLVHWHGQIPPNAQDGVPDMPMAALKPGEVRAYDFDTKPGTHWMHSHIAPQEMQLLAAPLIVRSAADVAEDRQEVVVMLHDFSFKPAAEVLAEITGGAGMMDHSAHGAASGTMDMGAMDMAGMDMSEMDLNDYNFDAYLANDRTLNDPEVVAVENGGRVLLRVINGASATVFWIETGAVPARLVAVDGNPVQPVAGARFGVAMGQRLDIALDLPKGVAAYPVLARREGAREQTGIILAVAGADVGRVDELAKEAAPAFDIDLAQEAGLAAVVPLNARATDKAEMLMLGGAMMPYVWTINGQSWADHVPVTAKAGARVELTFHNMSMMGHPMHLHGHVFQVVAINGKRFAGAVRDTVYVPPMAMVTVALDAGEAAAWMLHCHHVPHMATGMMTEFVVSA